MKTYRNEAVLHMLSCRLSPSSDLYPDYDCLVILTEEHCYVLEDFFDGTYEMLIQVPLSKLISLESYTEGQKTSKKGKVRAGGLNTQALTFLGTVLGAFTGLFVLVAGNNKQPASYLRLYYTDAEDEKQFLSFVQCDHHPSQMVKAWTKHRDRWGIR